MRDGEILELVLSGWPLGRTGERFGLTAERVRQIVSREVLRRNKGLYLSIKPGNTKEYRKYREIIAPGHWLGYLWRSARLGVI